MIARAAKRLLAATGRFHASRALALAAAGAAVRALPPGRARDRLIGPFTSYLLPPAFRKVITLPDGAKLHGTPRDILTRTVLYFGAHRLHCWEPQTTRLAIALGSRGDVLIGGGHVGYFAIRLARALREHGSTVVAFEPLPSAAEEFEANAALNGLANLRLERAALGAEAGSMTLYEQGIRSSLLEPQKGVTVARHAVRVETVDRYLAGATLKGPVGLLLLDVEGAERAVFEGARELLARADAPDVLFEIVGDPVIAPGTAAAYLRDAGFTLFVVLDDYGLRLDPRAAAAPIEVSPLEAYRGSERYVNVVATRRPETLRAAGVRAV